MVLQVLKRLEQVYEGFLKILTKIIKNSIFVFLGFSGFFLRFSLISIDFHYFPLKNMILHAQEPGKAAQGLP